MKGKRQLFEDGIRLIEAWCHLNHVDSPAVECSDEPTLWDTCAFYRDGTIKIAVGACAGIGMAGRAWSYPGYVVDRTPYGVLAHELGHHVDQAHGASGGLRSHAWRQETGEPPLTNYAATNDNEWFAESFRLFVTNPTLLELLQPRLFERLAAEWPNRTEMRPWSAVLAGVPRQLAAAANKIRAFEKRRSRPRTQLRLETVA